MVPKFPLPADGLLLDAAGGSSHVTCTLPRYGAVSAKPHWSLRGVAARAAEVPAVESGVGAPRNANVICDPSGCTVCTRPHARATLTSRSKCHVSKCPGNQRSTLTRKPSSVAWSLLTPSAHPAKLRTVDWLPPPPKPFERSPPAADRGGTDTVYEPGVGVATDRLSGVRSAAEAEMAGRRQK